MICATTSRLKSSRNSALPIVASLPQNLGRRRLENSGLFNQHSHNEVIDHLNGEMVMLERLYLGHETWEREMEDFLNEHVTPRVLPSWLTTEK